MENVFSSIATRYYEKGLIVTPIKYGEKRPILENWTDKNLYTDYDKIIDRFKSSNIGLLLGEPSGVIAIDIDKEEAMHLVPPSPVRKKGAKGETRFFKYSGELNAKNLKLGIELLSTGNQTVLPPSLHPSKINYAWITPDTLLDLNTNDLPTLSKDFINKFLTWGASESTGGRHNTLIKIMGGKVSDRKTSDQCIKETMEYDIQNHEVPYFTDKSETHGGSGYLAALKMYQSVVSTAIRRGDFIDPMETQEATFVDETPIVDTEPALKREKLPRLLGIGQKMFEYIYSMSTTPKSHQILSYVMSLSSVLMSNRYQLEGTFSNTFTLVFSESGGGKNEGQDFITALLEQSDMSGLIGERLAGGSTAMIMNLPDFRERIDIVSEGTRFFEAISSSKEYKSEMALIYSDLFNAGGKGFYNKSNQQEKKDNKGNKQGRIGECFSPCVTLLITINMSSSKMLIRNKMYEQGFMARLNVRLDSDRKKRKPYGGSIVDSIPYEFIAFIKSAGPVKKVMENKGSSFDLNKPLNDNTPHSLKKFIVPEIPVDKDAMDRIKEIEGEIIEMEYSIKSDDMLLYVVRRMYENFKKNILCITPLSLGRLTDLRVTMKEVEWAWELSKTDLNNHKLYLEQDMIDSKKELLMMKIFKIIKDGKRVAKSEICSKVRVDKREREEAMADLKECGYIEEIKENRTCFYTVLKNMKL